MHITTSHEFAADPQTVYRMLNSEEFLTMVAKEVRADQYSIDVGSDLTVLHAEVAAPQQARRFTGERLIINLTSKWVPAGPHAYRGSLDVDVDRMPASLSGTGDLHAGGKGTVVDYEADFAINIPLLGKKLEQVAAPYVRSVIDVQQKVGNAYLASRLA